MIGSVSSGFRRRRPRTATRAAVAAKTRAAGSRQLRLGDRAAVRETSACGSSNACRAIRAAWLELRSCGAWITTGSWCDCTFGAAAVGDAVAARERASASARFTSFTDAGAASPGVAAPTGLLGAVLSAGDFSASLLGALATAGNAVAAVASGAAWPVSEAELAGASTAGAAPGTGVVAAGSIEPAVSATAGAAASPAGGASGATRGGSKVKGST